MPEQDPFERHLIHQEHLQRVVDVAENWYGTRAAADPQLQEFAEARGSEVARTTQERLSIDEIPSASSQAEFEWGFSKLIFAFTNPADYADTISDAAFSELVHNRRQNIAMATPVIAGNFKIFAAHLLIIRFKQLDTGTARGGTADESFVATCEYFQRSLRAAGRSWNEPNDSGLGDSPN